MLNPRFLKLLIFKELGQILKDKSVLLIASVVPLVLVVIYGFAIRTDVKPVQLGIVVTQESEAATAIERGFMGSVYFNVTVVRSLEEGRDLMERHAIKALVIVPDNLSDELLQGRAEVMLILNGSEQQLSQLSAGYAQNTLTQSLKALYPGLSASGISVTARTWFNEANESSWFLMSGLYVAIATIMSTFLGAFVISREWDRGTMESLGATAASASEIVLSKLIAYYVLAAFGVMFMLILGQSILQIPIRGSMLLIILTLLVYVMEMLCLGMFISALCKNLFLAVEYAVIIGFLPTVLLSGLIFDLRGAHPVIQLIGYSIPPTYAVQALRISFLSGGQLSLVLRDLAIQVFYAALFFGLTVHKVGKDSK